MSEQKVVTGVKICPECAAEYYAHVETCKECKVALVFPDETASDGPQEFSVPGDWPAGDIAGLVEGPHARIKELSLALESAGIPHKIARMDCEEDVARSHSKCKPTDKYGIVVPRSIQETAVRAIDAYWQSEHPELSLVNERMEKGQCPACGFELSGSPAECPECGLNLAGPGNDGNATDGNCC